MEVLFCVGDVILFCEAAGISAGVDNKLPGGDMLLDEFAVWEWMYPRDEIPNKRAITIFI